MSTYCYLLFSKNDSTKDESQQFLIYEYAIESLYCYPCSKRKFNHFKSYFNDEGEIKNPLNRSFDILYKPSRFDAMLRLITEMKRKL